MNEICPHCGKVSTEESPRFCSGCGARMDGKSPAGYPGYTAPARGDQKNPWIAGACSTFLPGLGQVYNGETVKGFALFISTCAGLVILLVPGLIVWLYAMYNAYSTAAKMNTGEIPFREMRMLHVVLFVVFAVAVIIIGLFLLYVMFIEPLMSQFGSLGSGDVSQLFSTGGVL
jgi:TM2 domain-containing membrane protein YozV